MAKALSKNIHGNTKYTPERVKDFIDILKAGNSLKCSAAAVGVTRESIYLWMNRYPEFQEKVESARAYAERGFVSGLVREAKNGNVAAMIFALKAQYGWKEIQTIEHSVSEAPKRTDEWGNEIEAVQPGTGNNGHNRIESEVTEKPG